MKQIKIVLLTIASLSFFSCAKEEIIPVIADFDIKVLNEDYSVPVRVEIDNKTIGADTYHWAFEGANTTVSSEREPAQLTYLNKGNYTITLKASNKDGSEDTKSIDIKIDAAMKVDFEWEMLGSDISPVTLQMKDKSEGAVTYLWNFQGGIPETSSDVAPKVTFADSGEHLIRLTIDNGKENYSLEKTIHVKPAMTVDFDWTVDFVDNDYQAPVLLHLHNKSKNAASYAWQISGPSSLNSVDENPDMTFPIAGLYTIALTATNDKESKTLKKEITIYRDNNLLSFENINLGINTAHGSIGCFFSSQLGKVITRGEVNSEIGSKIDFVYFGLNDAFSFNQFISPDEAETTAFLQIPNAIHTKIVNSQEVVGIQLTAEQFDGITDGSAFDKITVTENNPGKSPFTGTLLPRIVLFQTEDGRKGAIKITAFIAAKKDSYIITDIKVQKKP